MGGLGQHPLLIKSLSHCLNYKLNLNKNRDSDSILGNVMVEMRAMADQSHNLNIERGRYKGLTVTQRTSLQILPNTQVGTNTHSKQCVLTK